MAYNGRGQFFDRAPTLRLLFRQPWRPLHHRYGRILMIELESMALGHDVTALSHLNARNYTGRYSLLGGGVSFLRCHYSFSALRA
jgi:hypothetical protein